MAKNSGKAPSFQFYPADWLRHAGLKLCSFNAKGVWADLMAQSYFMSKRGVFRDETGPISEPNLLEMLSGNASQKRRGFAELKKHKVIKQYEDGTFYVRRIKEDMELRDIRTAAGKKGGNPALLKQKVALAPICLTKPLTKQPSKTQPLHLQSSSSSITTPLPPTPEASKRTLSERTDFHLKAWIDISKYKPEMASRMPKNRQMIRDDCEIYHDVQLMTAIVEVGPECYSWLRIREALLKLARSQKLDDHTQAQIKATSDRLRKLRERAE